MYHLGGQKKLLFSSEVDVSDAGVGRAWTSQWALIRSLDLSSPKKKRAFPTSHPLVWQEGSSVNAWLQKNGPQLVESQRTEVQISSDQASSMAQGSLNDDQEKASGGTVDGHNRVNPCDG